MASRPNGPFIVEVIFEKREDGGLRAYCDKVPGLVLSHSNPDAVMADVEPALATILSAMYEMPMSVQRAENIGDDSFPEMPAYLCGAAQYVGQRSTT